jgi:hypothetical protein
MLAQQLLLVCGTAVGLVVGAAASATVFVTPGAMTLHEAQAAARLLLAADGPEGLVRVRLAAGVHSLARPLRLGPEDSSVLWQAEPGAVISGGAALSGWAEAADGSWVAALPPSVRFSRSLWINGQRRNRTIAHGADCCSVHPTSGIFILGGSLGTVELTNITARGYVANASSMLGLENKADIELLYTRVGTSWTEGRCTLQDIVPHASGAELVVKQPCFANQRNKSYNQAVSFPRSLEQLSLPELLQPGGWFLDRSNGTVRYMPTTNDRARGIANVDGSVLAAVGTDASSTALLELAGVTGGVRFEGVHFDQGGGWGGASTGLGYTETQAAYHASSADFNGFNDSAWVAVPAAIHVHSGSRAVSFAGCKFTRMGASAVMFSGGTQDCEITNSTFNDLSGSAVMLGQVDDWAQADETKQNAGFILADNRIANTSLEYRGSPGITAAYVRDSVIERNEISHLSYSGVSLGWGWGREDSCAFSAAFSFCKFRYVLGLV